MLIGHPAVQRVSMTFFFLFYNIRVLHPLSSPYHDTQVGFPASFHWPDRFSPGNPSACSRAHSWSVRHSPPWTPLPDGYHAREHLDLHTARWTLLKQCEEHVFMNGTLIARKKVHTFWQYENLTPVENSTSTPCMSDVYISNTMIEE